VARTAIEASVRSYQREAVLVVVDCLYCNLPALHGVTLFAVGAHLAAVNIGVTVGASRADIAEDEIAMTLLTGYVGVHSTERIFSSVVIEVRQTANRPPGSIGVAVLAR
jgi:hypothetical protein